MKGYGGVEFYIEKMCGEMVTPESFRITQIALDTFELC